MSEPRKHGLTFAAVGISFSSRVGHAFILWEEEDNQAQMSISKGLGFYPATGNSAYEVLFGGPGVIRSDVDRVPERRLTVLVNTPVWNAALARRNQWHQSGTYQITAQNCVSHVHDIAAVLGLETPASDWTRPLTYIGDLDAANP